MSDEYDVIYVCLLRRKYPGYSITHNEIRANAMRVLWLLPPSNRSPKNDRRIRFCRNLTEFIIRIISGWFDHFYDNKNLRQGVNRQYAVRFMEIARGKSPLFENSKTSNKRWDFRRRARIIVKDALIDSVVVHNPFRGDICACTVYCSSIISLAQTEMH